MHNLTMLAFPHTPTRVAPVAHKFVWPHRDPKVDPFRSESSSQLTDFLQNPPNPQRTLPVHDIIHIPKSQFFYLGFLFWHLWMTHPPRMRVNTCAQVCTKLTHVLSRKVLSLTKPKGKIYKAKSLGHYIAYRALSNTIFFINDYEICERKL